MSILEDSSSYQLILEKGMAKGREAGRAEGRETGRQEEVIAILLRLGAKKFGPPDGATEAALLEITDLARLERMSERLLDVANWADLLATS